ncbi:MAG: rod shape-determining protein MreC [Bacteroidales bacterium OttesenSCG-928-I14]|nr:rod shape-determining protein MreC [Bacteroidales bacterium OttesenSCG-928-I14]
MRNLFRFFLRNVHWVLFLLLLVFSVILIINNNQMQRSRYFVVVREVLGRFYSIVDVFQSYINLNVTNAELMRKVSELETEIYKYKNILELIKDSIQTTSINIDSLHAIVYQFIPARVVDNSIFRKENYIILNKGSENGIESDMGVVSYNGIVGIVISTSPHFSEVISLLNPQLKLSCKIKNNDHFGPLIWDGKDSRYTCLTEFPNYVPIKIGDTIITSGYSAIFPEGIPVGIVTGLQKKKNDIYTTLKVKFFIDFGNLNEVLIVKNVYQKEQNDIRKIIVQ